MIPGEPGWVWTDDADAEPDAVTASRGMPFGYFYSAVLFLLGHILMRG